MAVYIIVSMTHGHTNIKYPTISKFFGSISRSLSQGWHTHYCTILFKIQKYYATPQSRVLTQKTTVVRLANKLCTLGFCDRASSANCEKRERKPTRCNNQMFIFNNFSTCFGHYYAHLQENKDRVLLHVVCCAGSAGCGW